jgi:Fe2+ transport system protein FeoA
LTELPVGITAKITHIEFCDIFEQLFSLGFTPGETVKVINTIKEGKATITQTDLEILTKEVNAFVFDVLGLATLSSAGDDSKLEGVMDLVLNLRQQARIFNIIKTIRNRKLFKNISFIISG